MAAGPPLGVRRGVVLGASLALPLVLVFGLGHRGVHMMRSMFVPGAGLVGSNNLAGGSVCRRCRSGHDRLGAVGDGLAARHGRRRCRVGQWPRVGPARRRHGVDGVGRCGGRARGRCPRISVGAARRGTDLVAAQRGRPHSWAVAPGTSPGPQLGRVLPPSTGCRLSSDRAPPPCSRWPVTSTSPARSPPTRRSNAGRDVWGCGPGSGPVAIRSAPTTPMPEPR